MPASEAPKLFTNKPKKSQLKQSKDFASATMSAQPSAPPPPPPRESFLRRYKFVWPVLLVFNGAYLFWRTKDKDTNEVEEVAAALPSAPVATVPSQMIPVTEKALPSVPIAEPLKLPEPVPEAQQRELFTWILEEKRKVKPKNSEEKKRIDEEKAILKQLIRAKSIPSI